MNCPACGGDSAPSELAIPSRRDAATGVLRDLRVWGVAFAAMILAHLLAIAVGFSSRVASAAAGGVAGAYVGTRMGRYRICPKCSKLIVPT